MREIKEIVIGFLGCGNVGSGVWELLQGIAPELARREGLSIRVKRILVRNPAKPRGCSAPEVLFTASPENVLDDPEIALVAEFMGGEQPAAAYMLRALQAGKTVVTANKMALALHWETLQTAAQAHGAGLYYEASVCGAIPILNVLTSSLQANRVTKLMGIINGTTNYILSRMSAQGEPYDAVLQDAQRLGLAEPDPSSDVEGMDAVYKLCILASLAFHARIPLEFVYREGITRIAATDIVYGKEMGYVLKLLAIAKREGNTVEARVHPTFLPREHPLASVDGSFNAVYLHGHACKEMMLQGRGAGDMPTASAVVGDILRAVQTAKPLYPSFASAADPAEALILSDNWTTRYYIRLSANDAPGVLSSVAGCFARENVSIASMLQKDTAEDDRVPLIFVTHAAPEHAMRAALAQLDPSLCHLESMIRVED